MDIPLGVASDFDSNKNSDNNSENFLDALISSHFQAKKNEEKNSENISINSKNSGSDADSLFGSPRTGSQNSGNNTTQTPKNSSTGKTTQNSTPTTMSAPPSKPSPASSPPSASTSSSTSALASVRRVPPLPECSPNIDEESEHSESGEQAEKVEIPPVNGNSKKVKKSDDFLSGNFNDVDSDENLQKMKDEPESDGGLGGMKRARPNDDLGPPTKKLKSQHENQNESNSGDKLMDIDQKQNVPVVGKSKNQVFQNLQFVVVGFSVSVLKIDGNTNCSGPLRRS